MTVTTNLFLSRSNLLWRNGYTVENCSNKSKNNTPSFQCSKAFSLKVAIIFDVTTTGLLNNRISKRRKWFKGQRLGPVNYMAYEKATSNAHVTIRNVIFVNS